MLGALAKNALINIQRLLPSSLEVQPSSSQARGGEMMRLLMALPKVSWRSGRDVGAPAILQCIPSLP